jgi:predicted DsbA family dithiol-disulfide isomerase
MTRLLIKILEPEVEKSEAMVMDAIMAVQGLPIVAEVEKIRDLDKIKKKYDVTEVPGVVINGKVMITGRAPQREEIKKWLHEEFKLGRNLN